MSAGIDFHIHFYNLDTLKPIKVIQPEKITKTINAYVNTEISSDNNNNNGDNMGVNVNMNKEKVEKRPISNE
jgi:hypothetical protein